jgi:ribosomal protein S3
MLAPDSQEELNDGYDRIVQKNIAKCNAAFRSAAYSAIHRSCKSNAVGDAIRPAGAVGGSGARPARLPARKR